MVLPLASCLAAAAPKPLEPGVVATYSGGGRHVTRVTVDPNFTLQAGETVHPQVPADFSLAYDGVVRILNEADYSIEAEGGGVVTVDGKAGERVHLAAGDHAIHVEYVRKAGPARLQLVWSSGAFPVEPVPAGVLGHVGAPAEVKESAEVERGRLLVQELNCVGCHAPPAATLSGRRGPDLSAVGSRVRAEWIDKWLEDPRHFRAQGVMPVVLRGEQDRRDVAAYLGGLKRAKAEARAVTPSDELVRAGRALFESVGCANCHNAVAGPTLEGQASKWASVAELSQYLMDPTAVDPSGRMPGMMLDQGQADALAAFLFAGAGRSKVAGFDVAFQGGDAQRGHLLVQTAGCVNCHAVGSETSKLAATPPGLGSLRQDAGCLATEPPVGVPAYGLGEEDRRAIASYLRAVARQPEVGAAAPVYAFREDVRRFNCGACHSTGEGAGHAAGMDGVPPLSVAGQKLRPEWVKGVLEEKQRVRPWLKTRMPHFGGAVHPLVAEVAATSGEGEAEKVGAPSAQLVAEGRRLVGAGQGGFSCITCHSVNNGPVAAPEQSRGPELTLMARRLRADWFRRWVREPARVIPNTVMPSFFAGKPAEESGKQIEAIWAYLSLGEGMPTPNGANQSGQSKFVLAAADQPVVQRCYLDGGGVGGLFNPIPRAVAVGLPGGVSYAFDPEAGQFRYAWVGEFLDMTGGWNGRGDTHGKRLGRPIYNAPTAPQVYVGSLAAKPAIAYRGYSVAGGGVNLVYAVNKVEITERVTGMPHSEGLVRTFSVGPTAERVYLVFPDDPGVGVATSAGQFAPVPAPAGWDAKAKVVAVELAGGSSVSITITPKAEGK